MPDFSISHLVKDLRENYFKSSQQELADWLGVKIGVVKNIEGGQNDPTGSICLKLAAYARTPEERERFLILGGLDYKSIWKLADVLKKQEGKKRPGKPVNEDQSVYRSLLMLPENPIEDQAVERLLNILRSPDEEVKKAIIQNLNQFYKLVKIEKRISDEASKKKETA